MRKKIFFVLCTFFLLSPALFSQQVQKFKYIGNKDSYPYEFLDKGGKPEGFNIDLIKAIGQVMNFDVDVQLTQWKQVNESITFSSGYDISAIFYSENKTQDVDYSDPVLLSEDEIFVRNGDKSINSIFDLFNKKIAVEEGSYTEEYLENNLPEVSLIFAGSEPEALQMLSQGKCDAAIVERIVGDRSASRLGLTNIHTTAYPIIPREFGFVVPKDDTALLSEINLGLAVVKKNGVYASLFNKWITQTVPKTITVQSIVKWGVIVVAFILLIIGIIFFWIKSLRRLVNIRTAELRNEVEEHIKTENELIIQKERAEESDKLKSEFLAQMSHEIRTPLNVILGYVSLLEMEIKDYFRDDLVDLLDGIKDASHRLMRTVTSILDMSSLRTKKYQAHLELISLNDVLESLYHNFYDKAKNKNIKFELLQETASVRIKADYYTTEKLFENLIDNAVKFTKDGSILIKTEKTQNGKVMVEIADTGIGISDDYLPKIYEPFTQESSGNTRRFEGNGLGLSLVKEYAQINNYEIKIDSEKGKGTCVTIFLPTA